MKTSRTLIFFASLFFFITAGMFTNPIFSPSDTKPKKEQTAHYIFEDSFSHQEQIRLKKWVNTFFNATQEVLGDYPFDTYFYFKKAANSKESVPWAHTIRSKKQGVRFHVDLSFPDSILYNDWTAPHEISHLSLPFLGKSKSWFAEGYASYMQEQIRFHGGFITAQELKLKYKTKFLNAQRCCDSDKPFLENFKELRSEYNFPAFYWGGAYYFYLVDEQLHQNNQSLNGIIQKYQKKFRNQNQDFIHLIDQLDMLSNSKIFSKTLVKFQTQKADFKMN